MIFISPGGGRFDLFLAIEHGNSAMGLLFMSIAVTVNLERDTLMNVALSPTATGETSGIFIFVPGTTFSHTMCGLSRLSVFCVTCPRSANISFIVS